jgi:hypothetical protein
MYALLFIIPVLVSLFIAKVVLHVSFTWKEMAVQAVVTSLVIGGLFLAGSYGQTYDVKFVNGVVSELEPRQRSCPSGWVRYTDSHCTEYRTRRVKDGTQTCTTDSKTNRRTCVDNYVTEYNYYYDWERRYFVHADYSPNSTNVQYEIDRVDSQGVNTPPRFSAVKIGDPTAKEESFTNYIRAASDSLFSLEPPGEEVPLAYPGVHEQWLANRVIVFGVPMSGDEWGRWNDGLMKVNSEIRKTGANAIVVVTSSPQSFSEMLARAWEAHNINDVVVTIGVADNRVSWVDVRSWSKSSLVDVTIRDGISGLEVIDIDQINAIIQDSIQAHYVPRGMEEFEYLAEDITPPLWVMILAGIILLIVTPAVTYVFHREDVFGDER